MIAFDSASSRAFDGATSTWQHTTSGANRLLIVAVSHDTNSITYPTVTYAGVHMQYVAMSSSSLQKIQLFYLSNPALGTNNITITWPSSSSDSGGMAVSYTGVAQVAPVIASVTGNATRLSSTSSEADCLFIGAFNDAEDTANVRTPDSGTTERLDVLQGSGAGDFGGFIGDRIEATAGTYSVGYSVATTNQLNGVVAVFKPAKDAAVTTSAVGNVTDTEATLNANVTSHGGLGITERGFVYGTSSQPNPGNVTPGSSGYTANTQPQETGLVARWLMNEGSGTTAADTSGNAHNGAFVDAPTWINADADIALQFDGVNDYLNAGLIPGTNSIQRMTLMAWVRQDDPANTTRNAGFIHRATNDSTRWSLSPSQASIQGPDDGLALMANGGNTYGYTNNVNALTYGKWVHFTMVFDGTQAANADKMKMYFNGVQVSMLYGGTLPTIVPPSNNPVYLANYYSVGAGFLKGAMRDVRIYNRALSASEIADIASYTGTYSRALTGLAPATTYYVRAYVKNQNGYYYGDEQTFTTGGVTPAIDSFMPSAMLMAD